MSTTVYPLSHFAPASLHIPAHFHVETGGAELTLSMVASGDHLEVVRALVEPGAAGEKKTYSVPLPPPGAGRAGGDGLKLIGLADGVLVHEADSGTDGVDAGFWIYYGLVEPEGDANGKH